eukprot:SAG31_NODE_9022_length_1346_cov_2.893344_1_plen_209_part_00
MGLINATSVFMGSRRIDLAAAGSDVACSCRFASMLQMRAALLVLVSATGAATVTEYVGMAPSHAFPDNGGEPQPLRWAELTYDPAGNRAAAVRLSLLNVTSGTGGEAPPPLLGKWLDLDLTKGGGGGAALTAKVLKNKLYIYVDTRPAPPNSPGLGCCADTLRIVDRDTGNTTEWDLDAILGTGKKLLSRFCAHYQRNTGLLSRYATH